LANIEPRTPTEAQAYTRGIQDARAGRPFPPSRVFDRWPPAIQIIYERARMKSLENKAPSRSS